jgi:hypothetical protein
MFSLFYFVVIGGGRSRRVCAQLVFTNHRLIIVWFRVIIPTVTSLQATIRKYEEQGGTASIFVNDDGMQTVSDDLAE